MTRITKAQREAEDRLRAACRTAPGGQARRTTATLVRRQNAAWNVPGSLPPGPQFNGSAGSRSAALALAIARSR